MSSPLHAHIVPGWIVDDVIEEHDHTVVVAARGAEPVVPPAHPRFASIVIARPGHEEAAERELAELITSEAIGPGDIIESSIVMWDGHGVIARVMRAGASLAPHPAHPRLDAPEPEPLTVEPVEQRRHDTKVSLVATAMVAVGMVAAILALTHGSSPATRSASDAAPQADRVGVVTWDPLTATASVERGGRVLTYQLGRPGDELLLGDWTGNGARNPALYRPSTGEVWLFTDWATEDEPVEPHVAAEAPTHGHAAVVARDGRDFVEVTPRSG